MVEYLDSLTSGVGQDLVEQVVVITDRVSGRLMGIRPDMTPQAARIDAHALNESRTTRSAIAGASCELCRPTVTKSIPCPVRC